MSFPMARTADARVQLQDLSLREFNNIVTQALNKSGADRNDTTHIHSAIATLRGNEVYAALLTTDRRAVNSYNCLLTVINQPALPLPPISLALASLSDDQARSMLANINSGALNVPPQNATQSIAGTRAVPRFAPGWIEWMVLKVVEAGAAVRDGAVAGGAMAYDSATSLFQNLWMIEGLTPEERQQIVAVLEGRVAAVEEKKQ